MPETTTMTQRQALEGGRHGDFAAALYKAAQSGDIWDLCDAWCKGDTGNQDKLEAIFPGLGRIAIQTYNHWPMRHGWLGTLAHHFPHLDGDLDGPVRYPEAGRTEVVQHGEIGGINVIELRRVPTSDDGCGQGREG